ncbi:hypothetical protein AYI68_g1308, partial [Smittium mucronatum]
MPSKNLAFSNSIFCPAAPARSWLKDFLDSPPQGVFQLVPTKLHW